MAPLQVIGAGLGRTGTHSLYLALNKLGYNTHHMKELLIDPTLDSLAFKHNYLHPEDPIDWDKIYEKYDAAVDFPTCQFVEPLIKKYPDAKVILTVREPESWFKSASNTIFKMGAVAKEQGFEGNPHLKDVFEMTTTMIVDGLLEGRLQDKELATCKFVEHNEHIKAIVPPECLLIMELGDGWEKLCPFLGKEIPGEPYPRSNSTEEFAALREGFIGGANAREAYGSTIGKV